MNSLFRKLLQAAVVVGLMINLASAYDLNKKTSVSIVKCGFGKFPYQFKLNQFSNQVDVILFGCLDENLNVKLVKSAGDYANLVPVQFTMNFPDNGIKVKKTSPGYYYADGTYTTKIAASLLLPKENYNKDFDNDFLMEALKSGNPTKMVFANLDQFKIVKNSLQVKFENPEVAAESIDDAQLIDVSSVANPIKPLLLIEIASNEEIPQADIDDLNAHFDIADPKDEAVQAFFNKVEKTISKLKDFTQVGKSFGDMIMESIDKDFDNGDVKKLTVRAIKFVALALTFAVVADLSKTYIIDPIKTKVGNIFDDSAEKIAEARRKLKECFEAEDPSELHPPVLEEGK